MADKYLFEDWINGKLFNIKINDRFLLNDSENYLDLCEEQMDLEELNKIQDAQKETYYYIIKSTLEYYQRIFYQKLRSSLHKKDFIFISIKNAEKYLNENESFYFDIIQPKKYRGIPIGAKYLLPIFYLKYKADKPLNGFHLIPGNSLQIFNSEERINLPSADQLKYLRTEIQFKWLNKLKEIEAEINKQDESFKLENPINIALLERFKKIDKSLELRKLKWKLIDYAAWCEWLFENHYFERYENRQETIISFAKAQYGKNVKASIASGKDKRKRRAESLKRFISIINNTK